MVPFHVKCKDIYTSKQRQGTQLNRPSPFPICSGKGREWPLYVMSTCYAMNTFVSLSTAFSPYELVFSKKPPDILNLYFEPLQTIAKGYEDYTLIIKHRLEHVGNVI